MPSNSSNRIKPAGRSALAPMRARRGGPASCHPQEAEPLRVPPDAGYTWLHTHPDGICTQVRYRVRWLTASHGTWVTTHPLGNIIQFHGLHSDSKDLDLT